MIRTLVTAAVAAACLSVGRAAPAQTDGGDTPSGPAESSVVPERQFSGFIAGGRAIRGWIDDDGRYFIIYSRPDATDSPAGLIVGVGTERAGVFDSVDARDLSLEGRAPVAARLRLGTDGQRIVGRVLYGASDEVHLEGQPTAASPGSAARRAFYEGEFASRDRGGMARLVIEPGGTVTGSNGGCRIDGGMVSRPGSAIHPIALTFSGTDCTHPGQTLQGTAHFDQTERLYVALTDSSRSNAVLFIAVPR
jgi:hypothetical protein